MDDLISRQAAIDALMVWEEESIWDEECLEHRGEPFLTAPSDVVEQLPSAQPEIVRCKDCKWWEKKEDSTLGYCNAVKHWHFSDHLEIQIYSRYEPDFFCANGERRSENERSD